MTMTHSTRWSTFGSVLSVSKWRIFTGNTQFIITYRRQNRESLEPDIKIQSHLLRAGTHPTRFFLCHLLCAVTWILRNVRVSLLGIGFVGFVESRSARSAGVDWERFVGFRDLILGTFQDSRMTIPWWDGELLTAAVLRYVATTLGDRIQCFTKIPSYQGLKATSRSEIQLGCLRYVYIYQ